MKYFFDTSSLVKTLDSLQFAFFTTYGDESDVFVCSDMKLANLVRIEGMAVYVPGLDQ